MASVSLTRFLQPVRFNSWVRKLSSHAKQPEKSPRSQGHPNWEASENGAGTRSLRPSEYVQNIGIIGAGQMGTGIALVSAQAAACNVAITDSSQSGVDSSKRFLEHHLARAVSKGKLTETERDLVHSRITYSKDIECLRDVDFAIEAVTEDTAVKRQLFKRAAALTRPDVILASNTSSISITKIAAATDRPSKVVGMHFFHPVPVLQLVEVIAGLLTDEETITVTVDLAARMGKTVTRSSDSPGFISNRVLMPYINEAIHALHESVGTAKDIDDTIRLGTGVPMGPLALADFIGLDTCLNIMRVLHTEFGDDKFRPSVLLIKHVDAGFLGKKTGRGFYTYA